MGFEELLYTWTQGYREYSREQEIYLSKEKIHFLKLRLIYSRLGWEGMWEVCRAGSSGKLVFTWSGKKKTLHLSVHPQQTGVGKKPENVFQQLLRKEQGNDLALEFQLSKQKWKLLSATFILTVIESMQKAGGGKGRGRAEGGQQRDVLGEARGVVSRNIC